MEEGCLSYPGLFLNIVRPQSVIVKYETEDCRTYKVKLDGMASRIFQHEYDHMQGIDFTQRAKWKYQIGNIILKKKRNDISNRRRYVLQEKDVDSY